ncbi:hypothetical protein IMG5_137300 [Ichthyophthirius multifiliis]|uniref:Transmembrane protein n=1 Tax=Ichthyophthirius multifiliis TaxID=5932 RepID=G0QX23_ICHMU|nr:hypothetical protein IMG5_137300 [Ichthyophthirius multifiliis]EGR30234.1 hypothetical protein IMG5_137300 [Ichthyophthirius multifiliis]|eukprot:XP_004031830.1 hypothetical protein IMG5_137300 [Ichthyophthirius multifiliis]
MFQQNILKIRKSNTFFITQNFEIGIILNIKIQIFCEIMFRYKRNRSSQIIIQISLKIQGQTITIIFFSLCMVNIYFCISSFSCLLFLKVYFVILSTYFFIKKLIKLIQVIII